MWDLGEPLYVSVYICHVNAYNYLQHPSLPCWFHNVPYAGKFAIFAFADPCSVFGKGNPELSNRDPLQAGSKWQAERFVFSPNMRRNSPCVHCESVCSTCSDLNTASPRFAKQNFASGGLEKVTQLRRLCQVDGLVPDFHIYVT